MEGGIEAAFLRRLIHLYRRHQIDQPQHRVGEDEGPHGGEHDSRELFEEEGRVAAQQTVGARRIEKRGGKRFELTRIDSGPVNFNAQMDQIFREIPAEGKRVKTNLARTLLKERE